MTSHVKAAPSVIARRALFLVLSAVSTGLGIYGAARLLDVATPFSGLAATILLVVFGVLFCWISANFWLTVYGFVALAWSRLTAARRANNADTAPPVQPAARTAVAMPIYNESPDRVESGLRAMIELLRRSGDLAHFDFYILSDTNNPELWQSEEEMWRRLAALGDDSCGVYYRRRSDNVERKSGNIKDFLELWGRDYRYMVVLDADSVLDAETLIEMVRRMEANPRLGLLQTRPQVIGGSTLFARFQQFASWLQGRLIGYGMAVLFGPHGNYWGHNAIIRVDAFMESCGLPRLPGKEPLGGEVLSHDFVEAALLVRNGWEVRMAADLEGSYEEGPTNLLHSVARDCRWCQGNLQHFWVMVALGIHPASRATLLTGIMGYLSGPIWLLFIIATVALSLLQSGTFSPVLEFAQRASSASVIWSVTPVTSQVWIAVSLLIATVTFLLGPKLLGLIIAAFEQPRRLPTIIPSVILEAVTSFLLAPCVMLRHSAFILRLFAGRGVKWTPQQRDSERVTWREAWNAQWDHTLIGVAWLSLALVYPGPLAFWAAPIFLGLALSVPMVVLTGSARVGRAFHRLGLFTIPIEAAPPQVLRLAFAADDEPQSMQRKARQRRLSRAEAR